MLSVTISASRITVSGHALFAPRGADLVCAAVSGIVLGTEAIFQKKGMRVDRKNATITLEAEAGEKEKQAALKVVQTQLEAIAASYPQNVQIIRE